MSEEPSIWTLDRQGLEQTLASGRSFRRDYTAREMAAIREVLSRPDFEDLSAAQRHDFYVESWRAQPSDPLTGTEPGHSSTGSALATIGWLLIVGSILLSLYAYAGYNTSVSSDSSFVGGEYIPVRSIINNGLLQNQLMLFLAGLTGFVSGVSALVANSIVAAVRLAKDKP